MFHPIYSDAVDYRPVMKEWMAKKGKEEAAATFHEEMDGNYSVESNFKCGKQKEIC